MVGPLPYVVCTVNVCIKNIAHINVSLFTLAITATKFAFVCIYKSIPIMEDNFLSTVIYATSNTISILGAAAKLYLPGRPILNVVNTYIKYIILMKPEVTASDNCIYLSRMIDVRPKRECMFVLFIILTARVNGQMIRLVLCC